MVWNPLSGTFPVQSRCVAAMAAVVTVATIIAISIISLLSLLLGALACFPPVAVVVLLTRVINTVPLSAAALDLAILAVNALVSPLQVCICLYLDCSVVCSRSHTHTACSSTTQMRESLFQKQIMKSG